MRKKTFYKKWCFISIVVVLAIGFTGALYGLSEKEKAKEDAMSEANAKKVEIEKLKEKEALAEKKKKEKQDKLEKEEKEKLTLKKEEQNRIAQKEETIEQQPPLTEKTVDPRTTDSNSQYYQATPEEIEQGRLMEQQAQEDFRANQNSDNAEISTDETTLSGFVNKYGMSPAMYKIQNEGMSEEEALKSTPDSMKTSGEIQLGHLNYGI